MILIEHTLTILIRVNDINLRLNSQNFFCNIIYGVHLFDYAKLARFNRFMSRRERKESVKPRVSFTRSVRDGENTDAQMDLAIQTC